jgi:glycosyltransferase involved in cell wall biosynthesis
MLSQEPSSSPLRVAVIIATKGRPQALNRLLRWLEHQTLAPSVVVVSATESVDTAGPIATSQPVEYIYGSAGSCIQRNRALERIKDRADLVIFFDDDFAPAATWLERCASAFATDRNIVGMSGLVLRDGAQAEEISWDEAKRLIQAAAPGDVNIPQFSERSGLYGCNMAFRASAIRQLRFDERLVLYGWMEDKDFSRLAGKSGRLVACSTLLGVHLGLKSGRVSGRRFGYSQVVNAWYLRKKGILSMREAWSNIGKALLMNGGKSFRSEKHVDRLGRFIGNLIGVGDLVLGRGRPEKAAEL